MADPQQTAAPASPPAPGVGLAKGEVTVQELTRVQQLIARRAAESRATVPSYDVTVTVDAEALLALRERRRAAQEPVPTITELVVEAVGRALREHPRLNGAYRDARVELHERVNVAVMVGTPEALYAPVIVDADRATVDEIGDQLRRLAARVREGEIEARELSGATFTVANLGKHGVDRFAAVITPPQAAILSVGAAAPRAVVRDGAVVARATMDLTLSCDHRIVYGEHAAAFLARVRDLLERAEV